jgi:hypothetical protein
MSVVGLLRWARNSALSLTLKTKRIITLAVVVHFNSYLNIKSCMWSSGPQRKILEVWIRTKANENVSVYDPKLMPKNGSTDPKMTFMM